MVNELQQTNTLIFKETFEYRRFISIKNFFFLLTKLFSKIKWSSYFFSPFLIEFYQNLIMSLRRVCPIKELIKRHIRLIITKFIKNVFSKTYFQKFSPEFLIKNSTSFRKKEWNSILQLNFHLFLEKIYNYDQIFKKNFKSYNKIKKNFIFKKKLKIIYKNYKQEVRIFPSQDFFLFVKSLKMFVSESKVHFSF
jgi:hypothetical protein